MDVVPYELVTAAGKQLRRFLVISAALFLALVLPVVGITAADAAPAATPTVISYEKTLIGLGPVVFAPKDTTVVLGTPVVFTNNVNNVLRLTVVHGSARSVTTLAPQASTAPVSYGAGRYALTGSSATAFPTGAAESAMGSLTVTAPPPSSPGARPPNSAAAPSPRPPTMGPPQAGGNKPAPARTPPPTQATVDPFLFFGNVPNTYPTFAPVNPAPGFNPNVAPSPAPSPSPSLSTSSAPGRLLPFAAAPPTSSSGRNPAAAQGTGLDRAAGSRGIGLPAAVAAVALVGMIGALGRVLLAQAGTCGGAHRGTASVDVHKP